MDRITLRSEVVEMIWLAGTVKICNLSTTCQPAYFIVSDQLKALLNIQEENDL
jgi:hypothetical protein